jgi:hypothetical protein
MNQNIGLLDRVIVPGWVNGHGEDKTGMVVKLKMFIGEKKVVTVKYDHPDPDGEFGIAVYEHQVIKI